MSEPPSTDAPKGLSVEEMYYKQLGHFIGTYSMTEAFLKKLLWRVAGVSDRVGIALFSGTRADHAASLLRRCYEAKRQKMRPGLDRLLAQFAVITTFRNDVVHHEVDFKADPPVVTNKEWVLSPRTLRETPISEWALFNATMDLLYIAMGLAALTEKKRVTPAFKKLFETASSATWLHKPPAQASKGRRSGKRKPRPKPKPPQKPSRV